MKLKNNHFIQQHNLNAYRKQLLPKIQIFTSFSSAELIVARCAIVLFWFLVGPVRPDVSTFSGRGRGSWLDDENKLRATNRPSDWKVLVVGPLRPRALRRFSFDKSKLY